MAAVIQAAEPAEQKVLLDHVSWETYERLLAEQQSSTTRFSYDQGTLEIMILSLRHERLKHLLATLVEVIAETLELDVEGAGSTTFRREDLARGFEPDACFYFQQAAQIRGQDDIDLSLDPAPELVIEIDISSPSLDKFPIFASLGVQEVWRHDSKTLTLFGLANTDYRELAHSTVLSGISATALNRWLSRGQSMPRSQWLAEVRRESRATH